MKKTDDSDALRDRVERLEELVAEQQETINELREDADSGGISRRAALGAALGAAGVGSLTTSVAAAPSYGSASGAVGTSGNPLSETVAQTGRFRDVVLDNEVRDTGGTTRMALNSNVTSINDDEGREAFGSNNGLRTTIRSYPNQPVAVFDQETQDVAVVYCAGPENGKLSRPNATLDMGGEGGSGSGEINNVADRIVFAKRTNGSSKAELFNDSNGNIAVQDEDGNIKQLI